MHEARRVAYYNCEISPPAKLGALRRTRRGTGALVLVTEDEAPFLKVVGRNLDGHSIAGEGLNPVLFHPSGRVRDKLMTIVELNAIAGIGQYLEDEALELQEFFLRHVMILPIGRPNAERLEPPRASAAHGD